MKIVTLILTLMLAACEFLSPPPVWWLVCDGNPLAKSTSPSELQGVSRGYWIDQDGRATYFPLERYRVCRIVPEKMLWLATVEREAGNGR